MSVRFGAYSSNEVNSDSAWIADADWVLIVEAIERMAQTPGGNLDDEIGGLRTILGKYVGKWTTIPRAELVAHIKRLALPGEMTENARLWVFESLKP